MATIQITTTAAQDTRIIAAYRAKKGSPNATGADVKAWLIQELVDMVHGYETERDSAIAANAVVRMTDPT